MSKPTRSPDQTVLGVSMSKDLKDRIKALADADDRTMAKWCALQLARIVQDLNQSKIQATPSNGPTTFDVIQNGKPRAKKGA